MWRFKCSERRLFLRKKPLGMGAFPLQQLENRYSLPEPWLGAAAAPGDLVSNYQTRQ
jgi:hypothetical protein